jgi:hypothetical protein
VKLPLDPIFCPSLDVKVFDNRVIYKPLIGTTTIPFDKFLPWANSNNLSNVASSSASSSSSISQQINVDGTVVEAIPPAVDISIAIEIPPVAGVFS